MNLEWANPGFLTAGFAALLAPLIIHLLTRKTTRDISFPALQFIMAAMARQSRLFRLRHLILLLLRTIIVLLLLLVFARPSTFDTPRPDKPSASTENTIAAVVVLDSSASMHYRRGGVSLFSLGKASVEQILDKLPRNALVNLILAGTSAKSSYPELSGNHTTLREDLRHAMPSFARSSLRDAVTLAVTQLSRSEATIRELYILSDYQRSNVADAGFDTIPGDITVHHIPVQDQGPANAAISRVEVIPYKPGAGSDIEVTCAIRADGATVSDRIIELKVGPEVRIQRSISIPPGSTVTERFKFRIHREGIYDGVLSMADDNMPFDNTRYFTLNVSEKPLVIFLTDVADARNNSTRSIQLGIQPFEESVRGRYRCETVRSSDLLASLYRKPFALVLSGTRKWRAEESARLSRYVRDGGNVIWFLNSTDDALNYNAMNKAGDGIRLPFLCRDHFRISESGQDGRERWFMANTDHPILSRLREKYDFRRARVYQRFATERQPDAGQVIATYGGGDVALAVTESMGGKLIAANFSSGRESGDLDRHMYWVPMLHEMLGWCSHLERDEPPVFPGDPVRMVLPMTTMSTDLIAVTPSGEKMAVTLGASGGNTILVNLPEAVEPGFYSLRKDNHAVMSIAVNVDPRESDLNLLNPDDIQRLSPEENAWVSASVDTFDPAVIREGHAWWPYLVLLLLVFVVAEQAIAHATRKDA